MIIDTSRKVNFGVYQGTKITNYGKKTTGVFQNYKLDVHEGYEDNKLIHKLYYLYDKTGKWIKSKLEYYKDGKKILTVRRTGKWMTKFYNFSIM